MSEDVRSPCVDTSASITTEETSDFVILLILAMRVDLEGDHRSTERFEQLLLSLDVLHSKMRVLARVQLLLKSLPCVRERVHPSLDVRLGLS